MAITADTLESLVSDVFVKFLGETKWEFVPRATDTPTYSPKCSACRRFELIRSKTTRQAFWLVQTATLRSSR